MDQRKVSFEYKDYKDRENPHKVMTLSAEEFIRRFLQHVVPTGYHRIHMYGFLANGNRKRNLDKVKALLLPGHGVTELDPGFIEKFFKEMQVEAGKQCPKCEKGIMEEYESFSKSDIKVLFPYLFEKQAPD